MVTSSFRRQAEAHCYHQAETRRHLKQHCHPQ
ncbi:hypothetical protein AC13_4998, partial [Escherichia coli 2-011-08_S3_C2]